MKKRKIDVHQALSKKIKSNFWYFFANIILADLINKILIVDINSMETGYPKLIANSKIIL